jgi:hypothetical protein
MLFLGAMPAFARVLTPDVDFTIADACDAASVCTGVEVDSDLGGIRLAPGYDEGHVDMPFLVSDLRDRNLRIDATRGNSVRNGDFETLDESGEIPLVFEASSDSDDGPVGGIWMSSRANPSHGPWDCVPTGEADEDRGLCVDYNGQLKQLFPFVPGEHYRMRFSIDEWVDGCNDETCGGSDGLWLPDDKELNVKLAFYDASFTPIEFVNPRTLSATTSYTVASLLASAEGEHGFRFRTIDCEEHALYEGGSGSDPNDFIFEFCAGTDESNIAYTAIVFNMPNDDEPKRTAYVRLDDVVVDRESQVEISVLRESTGEVLATSTLSSGFLPVLEADLASDEPVLVRVTLRGADADSGPVVHGLALDTGHGLEVTAGTITACFERPRLGFTGLIPPVQEWNDAGQESLRTECDDPFADESEPSPLCADLLVENGVSRWRRAFQEHEAQLHWSDEEGLTLEPNAQATGTSRLAEMRKRDGRTMMHRHAELAANGFEILGIAEPLDIEGALDTLCAETGECASCDGSPECVLDLNAEYVRALVDLFDGSTSLSATTGETLFPPRIDRWQILVEHNLGAIDWYHTLFGADPFHAEDGQVLNALASAVWDAIEADEAAGERSGDDLIAVATSLNGNRGCYDRNYIEDVWNGSSSVDASLFTNFGYNTLINLKRSCDPEAFVTERDAVEAALPDDWRERLDSIGAYSVRRDLWDPADPEQLRGFGSRLAAKRTARQTLSNLSLPAEDIYWYSLFSSEGWVGKNLSEANYDADWRLSGWTALFDRKEGSGILTGDAGIEPDPDGASFDDTPTEFAPTDAGKVFLSISRALSTSSPATSDVAVQTDDWVRGTDHVTAAALDGEQYHSALYLDENGDWVLALWFLRDYEHGTGDDGRALSLFDGVLDDGFEDSRLHDIVVHGSADFDPLLAVRVERIHLDGSAASEVEIDDSTDSSVELPGVPLGEEPTLLRFVMDPGGTVECQVPEPGFGLGLMMGLTLLVAMRPGRHA